MSMNIREQLKAVYYNSKTWYAKVNRMSDAQVIAIYYKFKKEGKV
jgi:hypothetical protein